MEPEKKTENTVLCGANSYVEKYYFNGQFSRLPETVKEELQIMCVMFTEDVGGVLTLEFTPKGELQFKVASADTDYLFDEIGSALKIKQYQMEKRELLESLELYYRVFILGEGGKAAELLRQAEKTEPGESQEPGADREPGKGWEPELEREPAGEKEPAAGRKTGTGE